MTKADADAAVSERWRGDQAWVLEKLAFVGIVLTVVVAVATATWSIRGTITAEVRALEQRLDAQMEEFRGYMVDHFDGHPTDN